MGENSLQIESFIDSLWIEKGLSKNSLDSYSRDLNLFLKYLDKSKYSCSITDLFKNNLTHVFPLFG